MMSWGERFRVTLFGTSHGPEVGVVIEGLPKGHPVDVARLQAELDRRRPVGRRLATRRQEEDRLVIDAGVVDGRTDGGTFRAHVANEDVQRGPYDRRANVPRPGHADYPARVRYGPAADLSGGGIFSGRMTVGLVIAGTVAASLWPAPGLDIFAFPRSIGDVDARVADDEPNDRLRSRARGNEVGCPDPAAAAAMEAAIAKARRDGDSLGGVLEVRATGVPVGVGEPFFDSVESTVAHLAFAIPAVKGIEFGSGFAGARSSGSANNDAYFWEGERVAMRTNHAGGALGGLATGSPIVVRLAVKPTSSIAREQESVDLALRTPVRLVVAGRHDPCIVPRAVPVAEAVVAIALTDLARRGGFLP